MLVALCDYSDIVNGGRIITKGRRYDYVEYMMYPEYDEYSIIKDDQGNHSWVDARVFMTVVGYRNDILSSILG
jgi:hypothetical protein